MSPHRATGFKLDHSWIDVPGVEDERGRIMHQRGVTPSPGTFLLVRETIPRIPIYVLLRPRLGGFCYSDEEYAAIEVEVRA